MNISAKNSRPICSQMPKRTRASGKAASGPAKAASKARTTRTKKADSSEDSHDSNDSESDEEESSDEEDDSSAQSSEESDTEARERKKISAAEKAWREHRRVLQEQKKLALKELNELKAYTKMYVGVSFHCTASEIATEGKTGKQIVARLLRRLKTECATYESFRSFAKPSSAEGQTEQDEDEVESEEDEDSEEQEHNLDASARKKKQKTTVPLTYREADEAEREMTAPKVNTGGKFEDDSEESPADDSLAESFVIYLEGGKMSEAQVEDVQALLKDFGVRKDKCQPVSIPDIFTWTCTDLNLIISAS